MTSFSKWLPGGHIRFFGFWMAWFRQRNSSLLWNFSFRFHVHVLCGCRQKPNYVAFKMAALWFWTMFNCNPPIAHCHPLLWGGGILVDHWSIISSWFRKWPVAWSVTSHYLKQCWDIVELLGTNLSEILIESHTFSFRKMYLKSSSRKWQPFCL